MWLCNWSTNWHPDTPCLQAAADAARSLHGVRGFVPPSWEALSHGVRSEPLQPDEFEPGCQRGGWQHEAASRVEVQFRDENLFNRLDNASKALVRSQGGVGAGLAVSTCPLCRVTRLEPHLFRVLLLRRLRPLPCRAQVAGVAFHSIGHHRAACARAGILGRRGFAWRVSRPGSAAAGSPPMSWSVIWFGCAQHVRRETFGGGGGRPPSLRWCPVSCGHHHGQCPPYQWRSTERRSTHGRSGSGSCSQAEGAYLPRVDHPWGTRQVGRVGRRPMVD